MRTVIEIIGTPKSGKTLFVKKMNEGLSSKQFIISREYLQCHGLLIIIFAVSNDDICCVIKFLERIQHEPKYQNRKLLVLGNKRDLHESKKYRSCYSELIDLVRQSKGIYVAVSLKSNYNWLSVKKETDALSLSINKQ